MSITDMVERKQWKVAPPAPEGFIETMRPRHPLLAQVLYNRGFGTAEQAVAFLAHRGDLGNPFKLDGIPAGVTLIRQTIADGEPIAVYGDYDVDGVTATAVLVETLQALGANVRAYIPSREDEGYGLNREALRALAEEHVRLLITADCGIRSLDEVATARELGMRVIVTDHHHTGLALPQADVVINPKRAGSPREYFDLAGVGVAFKVAQALLRTNCRVPLATTQRELAEEDLLDLVALGTVADMVALREENHRLVSLGLDRINTGHRPGLSALLRVAGIDPGKVTAKTIGFVLGPRLNAAGRIDEAMAALDLLLAPDMASALPLAEKLDELNTVRRAITLDVRETARSMVLSRETLPPLIFAASDRFPSGVVGLAASRLLDEFYRPAVVVAVEDDFSKGSARSIPEFHITEALDTMDDLLVRHGGHAAAAGFTVKTSLLDELASRLTSLAQEKLGDVALIPTLYVDAEAPLSELSWELYRQLEELQPFGYGNLVPVFVSSEVRVLSARAVGAEGQHLKLYVADQAGRAWDAIAFRQGHWVERLPTWVDLAYMLEMNEWNGRISLQLNVQDIHPSA